MLRLSLSRASRFSQLATRRISASLGLAALGAVGCSNDDDPVNPANVGGSPSGTGGSGTGGTVAGAAGSSAGAENKGGTLGSGGSTDGAGGSLAGGGGESAIGGAAGNPSAGAGGSAGLGGGGGVTANLTLVNDSKLGRILNGSNFTLKCLNLAAA